MPDPAKSVGDIDDVLSSIRRLVAEQPGPKWQGKDGGPDGVVRPSADDRLVLTPALRVTESDTPPDDTTPTTRPPKTRPPMLRARTRHRHPRSPSPRMR
jgi:hypothetical protein